MSHILYLLASLDWFKSANGLSSPYWADGNGNGPTNGVIIDTTTIDDPIRNGAENIGAGIGWIKTDWVDSFSGAKNELLQSIQIGINWFLWFLALVALIYLIISWIQLLLSPKDDEAKKLMTRVQNAARAIGGIGLSWLIVSFIFWVVNQFVG